MLHTPIKISIKDFIKEIKFTTKIQDKLTHLIFHIKNANLYSESLKINTEANKFVLYSGQINLKKSYNHLLHVKDELLKIYWIGNFTLGESVFFKLILV